MRTAHNFIDITNLKFNSWTVIKRDIERQNINESYWICQCECGDLCSISGTALRKQKTKCCKKCRPKRQAYSRENPAQFIDKKFNQLTILRVSTAKDNKTRVTCRCDCGKEKDFFLYNLLNNHTKSCGHRKGGRTKNKQGYILITNKTHPKADSNGYVLEHRFVMEKYLGRYLNEGETVHHINGKRDQNNIENLELWASKHPPGQKVQDLVSYAKEILEKYDNYRNPTKKYFQYQIIKSTNTYTGNTLSENKGNTITISSQI